MAQPQVAPAALNNPIPTDPDGVPTFEFSDDQPLFAFFTSDIAGGRVCVMGEDEPTETTCDEPAWGEPNVVVGIGSQFTLIEEPSLVSGRWVLRTEVQIEDGDDPDDEPDWGFYAESQPFDVYPCSLEADGCNTALGRAIADDFKASAVPGRTFSQLTCAAFAAKDLYDDLQTVASQAKKAGEFTRRVLEWGSDRKSAKGTRPAPDTADQDSQRLSPFETPGVQKALDVLKDLSCSVAQMYKDIVEDPPDPAFGTVFEPTFAFGGPLDTPLTETMAVELDRQAAFAEATLRAYERYQGAQLAGDLAGQQLQADAIGDFAHELSIVQREAGPLLRAWASAADADAFLSGPVLDEGHKAYLIALYERVRTVGLTDAEKSQLAAIEFTEEEIAAFPENYRYDVASVPVGPSLGDVVRELATTMEGMAAASDAFSREGWAVAARLLDTPANTAPTAVADSFTMQAGSVLELDAPGVLGNDTDAEADLLTAVLTQAPPDGTGTVALAEDGSLTFTPRSDFVGSTQFAYRASDGELTSAEALATIEVLEGPVNNAPEPVDDSYSVHAGTSLTVSAPGVLGNDGDPDADPLTASLLEGPPASSGELVLQPDGSFVFVPSNGFTGSVQFAYAASDGRTEVPAVVTIVVTNEKPVAGPDDYTVSSGRTLTVGSPGVLGNDSDADGDPLRASLVAAPPDGSGTVTVEPDGGFTFTSDPEFVGSTQFAYAASDGTTSTTAVVTIEVTAAPPTNAAPDAQDDDYSIAASSAAGAQATMRVPAPGVLTNDSDLDGDPLVAKLTSSPPVGEFVFAADGSFALRPPAGFRGDLSFTYSASDGLAESVATVTVSFLNSPPSANTILDEVTVAADTTLVVPAPGVMRGVVDGTVTPWSPPLRRLRLRERRAWPPMAPTPTHQIPGSTETISSWWR